MKKQIVKNNLVEPKHFGRGRPTKYRPEYVQFAKPLAKLGATDADLARWSIIYPEFCEAKLRRPQNRGS
jgi:hypothetical protein